ncbi:NAD(P)-dependent alcohol dehydrogenase [Luteimonas salinilitoris]
MGVLAVALRHDAACPPASALPEGATPMQAIRARCYGSVEVLAFEQVARPEPADDELLVRVHAAGVNPLDWHYMQGKPYVMRFSSGIGRPDDSRVGVDFAGTVEAVGRSVQRFKPGDAVFGGRNGAFAEYLVVKESGSVVHKPASVSFEQAAAAPVAAVTALQAVRDAGQVQPGQRVLINGASGGVGTYAVQIAKALGAHVTGVCSTRNLELVRSLGADRVIDYTQADFTEGAQRYDVIIDNVGNHPLRAYRRALEPDGILVMVTGPKTDPWLGPLTRLLWAQVSSPFVSQIQASLFADMNPQDLAVLRGMMEAGSLRSVIDQRHTLAQVPEAIAYLEQGRTRGKNVIVLVPEDGVSAGIEPAEEPRVVINTGSGSFLMQGGQGHEADTIRVYYHKPRSFGSHSPILIVLPGAGRNGDSYRDAWVDASEAHGVLILSPAYAEEAYDVAAYHMGGVIKNLELRDAQIDESGQVYRLKDEDILFEVNRLSGQWLFHDFDRLFDSAVAAVGSERTGYDMFGHSAGGQILHRLAIFHPKSKANRLLASNAGFYTLPRLDVAPIFGIQGTGLTEQGLKRSFRQKLVLFLGELDDENETRGIHLHTPLADRQGLGRRARGEYFYGESRKAAAALGTEFNWTIEVVPGVGHDQAAMAKAAAGYLYGQ